MCDEESFDSFCTRCAIQQRSSGLFVPSESSHRFLYHQWLAAAREKYTKRQSTVSVTPTEQRPPLKRVKEEVVTGDCCSGLADMLAQQLLVSLKRQTESDNVPVSLRRASQESFPMPQTSAEMPVFLGLAEAAIRLTLWTPKDTRLEHLAARLRPNLRTLEERGIIRLHHGCFPSLQMLMDLLSWRIIAHRWIRLTPEMRQVAVDGVLRLCDSLESSAAETLRAAVHELPSPTASFSSIDPASLSRLDTFVGRVSAAVPFQFSLCRELALLYPEPVGQLHVPGEATSPAQIVLKKEMLPRLVEEERINDDAEIRIGELLNETGTSAPALSAPTRRDLPTRHAPVVTAAPPSHPLVDVEPCARRVTRVSSGTPQVLHRNSTVGVRGHIPCISQYHARYAEPAKHASSECPYCATCHLMEIIFQGDKHNCTWRHWPTARKIKLHLKRFPLVMRLAEERAAALQRGVQLAATDKIPL